MRKRLCPQCGIANLYVKNAAGERLLIYVDQDFRIHPKHEGTSTAGYDLQTIYCLGCSWSGSARALKCRI